MKYNNALILPMKSKDNEMRKICIILFTAVVLPVCSQTAWTVWQCVDYAVEHNHSVRIASINYDTYCANKQEAIGSFLPSVSAQIGAQYNFGRAIDPETNTYTDVSTFYNNYALSASLPVFDGFARVHALRAAKADLLMGKNAVQQQSDQTALATFQAYINVLYYHGMVVMSKAKCDESKQTLRQTKMLVELGRKSIADLAQVEAQCSADDYSLIHNQNSFSTAMLALKKEMNYPLCDTLQVSLETDELYAMLCTSSDSRITDEVSEHNPELQMSYNAQQSALHNLRQTRASLLPTLYVSAGISTSYNKTLQVDNVKSFSQQFRNNGGEYIGATLSIPIFNRLSTLSSIRRARNNYHLACENYNQKRLELQKLYIEAVLDCNGYMKESEQMEKKVVSDSLAYALVRGQYEEGLVTAIDLQTSAASLLNSRALLLQSRLMAVLKERMARYYKGEMRMRHR